MKQIPRITGRDIVELVLLGLLVAIFGFIFLLVILATPVGWTDKAKALLCLGLAVAGLAGGFLWVWAMGRNAEVRRDLAKRRKAEAAHAEQWRNVVGKS